MSINIGIIDQRVRKLAEDLAAEFETRLKIPAQGNEQVNAKTKLSQDGDLYFDKAVAKIDAALNAMYAETPSWQRLSATFRGGQLLSELGVKP